MRGRYGTPEGLWREHPCHVSRELMGSAVRTPLNSFHKCYSHDYEQIDILNIFTRGLGEPSRLGDHSSVVNAP